VLVQLCTAPVLPVVLGNPSADLASRIRDVGGAQVSSTMSERRRSVKCFWRRLWRPVVALPGAQRESLRPLLGPFSTLVRMTV
jgi:hypothetical protein